MCLGEIVRLVEVATDGTARAERGGRTVPVSLLTLDEPVVAGDWVVMHSGLALQRLTDDEARGALALRSTSAGSTPAGSTPPGSTPPGSTETASPGSHRDELEREGPT